MRHAAWQEQAVARLGSQCDRVPMPKCRAVSAQVKRHIPDPPQNTAHQLLFGMGGTCQCMPRKVWQAILVDRLACVGAKSMRALAKASAHQTR